MYSIYATNTGNWGPDELYGQADRPIFETLQAARLVRDELAALCAKRGSPRGLEYHIEEIEDIEDIEEIE